MMDLILTLAWSHPLPAMTYQTTCTPQALISSYISNLMIMLILDNIMDSRFGLVQVILLYSYTQFNKMWRLNINVSLWHLILTVIFRLVTIDSALVPRVANGESCPQGTSMEQGNSCCCGNGCCWTSCSWTQPPKSCLRDMKVCILVIDTHNVSYWIAQCPGKGIFDID